MLLGERSISRLRATENARSFRIADWTVLAIYSAMVMATVARHEPWADEAQAWLIARDRGFGDMLWRGVRYEGTPGLWHALLWIPAHTGMPYAAMSWLAAAIAIAGVWVLLRYAPFPWPLKFLLPFTFFLGYQYAVVARSYVLFPLLTFAAAACFRVRNTLGVGVALALLANVSSHGFVVAAGFALAYAWFLPTDRPQNGARIAEDHAAATLPLRGPRPALWGRWRDHKPLPRIVPALVIYGAGALIAAVTAWQPPDVSFVQPQFTRILHHGGAAAEGHTAAQMAPSPGMKGRGVKDKAARALHLFSLGISTSLLFAAVVVLACIAWLIARGAAVLLIPIAFLLFVLAAVYMSPWHAGMVFVTLIAVLWIAWPARSGVPDYALAALLGIASLAQIPWTIHAIRYDIAGPYDGSEACARYLAAAHAGRISGEKAFGYTPYSTGILPWFRTNIFANQPPYAYWFWSKANRTAQDPAEIAAGRPDLVVIAYEETLPTPWSGTNTGIDAAVVKLRDTARADGYQLTRDFTGSMPMDGAFTAVNHCEVYSRTR